MRPRNYRLLAFERGELRGPLAEFARETNPRGLGVRALRALSRAKPGRVTLLGLRAGLGPGGEFSARPTGLLAKGLGRSLAENVNRSVLRKGQPLLRRGDQLIYTLYQPPLPSEPMLKVLASRLHLERKGRPLPATHTMQIISACQCDCIHCSAARHKTREREQLSTEECKDFIRQSQELGVVSIIFTGGEPLLRRDLCELIASVDAREAIAMIFTNGLLLTADNVKKLQDAGLFSLMVSLDSPEPVEHDKMRRVPGCFARAVDGIQRCLSAGLLCGISTYATPERVRDGQVLRLIELGRALGVHEVTVFDVVPTGRLLDRDEKELLTREEQRALCALEEDINSRRGYPHVITQAHVNGPTGAGCYAAWFQFYSTAFGDITPCDFTPLSFGNIRQDSLRTIWERMTAHPAYCGRSNHCRMQDREFRRHWIDRIPSRGPFPHPVEMLDRAQSEEGDEERSLASSLGVRG